MTRCGWVDATDPRAVAYHDQEWGVPRFEDRYLFEMLLLEGAQAGLSWTTILNKRAGYRQALDGFDPLRIAAYDDARLASLGENPAIVRNRLKIAAARSNARAYLALRDSGRRLSDLLWDFVDGAPVQNRWRRLSDVPAATPVSDAMAKALKRQGFRFVGSTICYALMQAIGMVNDHIVDCPRHAACAATAQSVPAKPLSDP